MKMIKKWIACLMAVGMMLSLTACGVSGDQVAVNKPQQKDPDAKKRIAVSMPTKDLQRWAQDGSNMKAQLEKQGYDVDIQYANNDIATQVSQIENMIAVNPDVLVVASIDGSALGTALQGAKGLGIPVISYDRLIMQSDAVSYYATFDNELVGELQGQYIEDKLDLKNAKGPFNIELFTGSSDDNNCNYFFGGAMKILQPYIDSGKLVVRSGSTTLAECATANWSTEEAQKRMENILAAYYAKNLGVPIAKLICASNDNKVLYDFFQTGTYDKNREFVLTTSPSMDILISSNLERLIYLICGEDSEKTKELMEELKTTGKYTITLEMKEKLADFAAGYSTEEETAESIHDTYQKTGYVMDTHTAVAAHVCGQYRAKSGDQTKCVIASTASPYKFVKSVMSAIDAENANADEFDLLPKLQEVSGVPMPQAIKDILDAKVLHDLECDADKMKDTVKGILGV